MQETLESFISTRFSALNLEVPEDDVEYIARLVEEEELEDEDKKEGVKGMLDMHLPDGQAPEGLDDTIDGVIEHWRIKNEEEKARQAEQVDEKAGAQESESESDGEGDVPKSKKGKAQAALIASLTPEELAAAQRRALLAQYGYVDEDEGRAAALDEAGGARGETLRRREEEKEAQERRSLIDAAIKAETKRRKKSKRANERVDLMAPNLNKEKVQVKQQMLRQAAKQESISVQARDKAALEKQRADQAKAKADKQKKAQKQERRA